MAATLCITVDYLIGGSDKMVMDKKMMKRLEKIDSLPQEDKERVYYFIDMVIRDANARQTYAS